MDVPMREEDVPVDEIILFTEVNDSLSIVSEVTYSMLSHGSFYVLDVTSFPCTKASKQEHDVVSWYVVNCLLQ